MANLCLRWQMETVVSIFRVLVSILLSMVALASLLRGIYLWFKLWCAGGESYAHTSLVIARLNFLAGAAVSLIVFLWNPEILLLPILLCSSLIWALVVYQSVASPYQLASWWQRIERSRKSQPRRPLKNPLEGVACTLKTEPDSFR